jgi:hypothetical protein
MVLLCGFRDSLIINEIARGVLKPEQDKTAFHREGFMEKARCAAIQFNIALGEVNRNLETVEAALDRVAKQGVRLAVNDCESMRPKRRV